MINVVKDANDIYDKIRYEVIRARLLFPGNKHQLAALTEEVGELAQALIDHERGKVKSTAIMEEAIQVAAMAIRVAEEGDAEFTKYLAPKQWK